MLNSHHKPPSEVLKKVIYDPDNLQSITEVAKASILSVAEVKLKTVISKPFNHFRHHMNYQHSSLFIYVLFIHFNRCVYG